VSARRAVTTLVALVVLASTTWTAPLPAQTQLAAPTLSLAGQDPWTSPAGTFTLRLRTSADPGEFRLTLTVHDRVISRSAFDATLTKQNPPLGQTLALLPLSLSDYPPDTNGVRAVALDTNTLNLGRAGNGVYPLEVQLRDGDDHTVAGFVTHVIVLDVTNGAPKPLDVAWLWPIVTRPAYLPDGSADPTVVDELKPGGRLGRQATAIGADLDVPITLVPSPETLEAWSMLSSGDVGLAGEAAALKSAVPRDQVVAGPYVPLDMPSLLASGFQSVVVDELDRGSEALQAFFSQHFDPSTAVPGPLDTRSVDALRAAARSRLVIDGTALEPYTGRFTAARPSLLARAPGSTANAVTAVVTDPGLERFLTGGDAPALRAAHLLAALSVIAGEQPSLARGVAFANPSSWNPSDDFVTSLFAGLRGNPLLRPVTVDRLLADTPAADARDEVGGAPVVRILAPVRTRRAPVASGEYFQALVDRKGIADLFGQTDVRVQRADRDLLSVLSVNWQTQSGRSRARAQLRSIGQSGRDFLALIRVPLKSTITLTSDKAKIPVTFRNDADRQVSIHLALQSSKLLFPDGTDRNLVLLPGKNQTVRIAIETRSSGTFPLVMTVTTAGGLPIQTSSVTVRSSFVSGVGVFLTVGALMFLALWWGLDFRRRRRRQST
jgi:hypothetical protein